MLKGKKARIIAVIAMLTVLLDVTVFAKQATETISVMYDNIKILIDGVEFTAKDVNGNVIEPFIYNGTTYLPVRGIANAFDVNVNWNENDKTVELGDNQFDFLSKMSVYDYQNNNEKCKYTVTNEQAAIRFLFEIGNFAPENLINQRITYKLSNKYKTLYATLKRPNSEGKSAYNIAIYGDEHKLLYESYYIDDEIEFDIEVDVSGNEYLYIEANASFLEFCNGYIDLKNAKLALP